MQPPLHALIPARYALTHCCTASPLLSTHRHTDARGDGIGQAAAGTGDPRSADQAQRLGGGGAGAAGADGGESAGHVHERFAVNNCYAGVKFDVVLQYIQYV
jgi:hypothetical protein